MCHLWFGKGTSEDGCTSHIAAVQRCAVHGLARAGLQLVYDQRSANRYPGHVFQVRRHQHVELMPKDLRDLSPRPQHSQRVRLLSKRRQNRHLGVQRHVHASRLYHPACHVLAALHPGNVRRHRRFHRCMLAVEPLPRNRQLVIHGRGKPCKGNVRRIGKGFAARHAGSGILLSAGDLRPSDVLPLSGKLQRVEQLSDSGRGPVDYLQGLHEAGRLRG
mmetsp:Transcript_50720/g.162854  ORF Transcript_50720/g.162854 Transcript_50720/m.162854 type:complete len:218 (+) Transcript_50720:65-718(+)